MVLIHALHIVAAAATDCTNGCDINLPKSTADTNAVKTFLQLTFGVVGALAVMYTVYGGFKFVMSQGDPGEASKARQTIIYAVAGLAIAVLAEAIVSLVLKSV